MDINSPIENPVLLELLNKLKAQFNADTEHDFFKELLSTKFLSPITQDSLQGCKNGENTLKEGATIKFMHLSDEKGYHLVQSERGNETSHKLTDNKFELSFWVIKLIVRTLAIEFMRKNVKPGESQREIILKKELELFGTVGESYFKVGEVYLNEMLKENPL